MVTCILIVVTYLEPCTRCIFWILAIDKTYIYLLKNLPLIVYESVIEGSVAQVCLRAALHHLFSSVRSTNVIGIFDSNKVGRARA